ncbi:MAG: hypothetical protein A2498_14960 [Lentisphaerae bacterium RIFOXYC12_FULL_60_16]|nr:MAG: hypothetical protein A2498_14960 [Lentisphaerae bacterium RIFOXYC12_FULL_60_16]
MILSGPVVAQTPYYVRTDGNDGSSGLDWGTAKQTITGALAVAGSPGDTVWVSNGTYNLTVQVNLTNNVTVRSVNGPAVTTVDAGSRSMVRCFQVNAAGALLAGFTITRGSLYNWGYGGAGVYLLNGTVSNCLFKANEAYDLGGAARVTGGHLTHCIISNNYGRAASGRGGGVHVSGGGRVSHSQIIGNRAYNHGGGAEVLGGVVSNCTFTGNLSGYGGYYADGSGIYQAGGLVTHSTIVSNGTGNTINGGGVFLNGGTLQNCLITHNSGTARGGGVYLDAGTGRLRHCTIARNLALLEGKGLYQAGGSVTNCIIYLNGTEQYAAFQQNVFKTGGTLGYSCTLPAIGGTGNRTDDPLFMDPDAGDFTLFPLSPCVDAGTNLVDLADDIDGRVRPQDGDNDGQALHDPGAYESANQATGPLACHFTAPTNEGFAALTAVFTAFVAGSNTTITWYGWDYDNNGVMDYEGPNAWKATNLFGMGFYDVTLSVSNQPTEAAECTRKNYIRVAAGTNYVSLAGSHTTPFDTWARAANDIQSAVNAAQTYGTVHPVILVTNGTYNLSAAISIQNRMTVRSMNGPKVTILDAGNVSPRRIFHVNATNAVVDGFTCRRGRIDLWDTGGAGILLDAGVVTNCIIENSAAYRYGGGAWVRGGLLTHSIIHGNQGHANGSYGGGIYLQGNGRVRNCFISNNWVWAVSPRGGGAYVTGGTVQNCLVTRNYASDDGRGGGIYATAGHILNCTIVTNWATTAGGGAYSAGGAFTNCIFYLNAAPASADVAGTNFVTYSCSPDLAAGVNGNLGGDPGFLNSTNGDYRLAKTSRCINAGINQDWMVGATDLSNQVRRIVRVDMGAFEDKGIPGSVVIVR